MATYNQEEKNRFLINFLSAKKQGFILLVWHKKWMYVGLPVVYISAITGILIGQLDQLQ